MKKFFAFLFIVLSLFFVSGCEKEKENDVKEPVIENGAGGEVLEEVNKKLQIIDEDSNSRPYGVIINNYPGAVKVQTGLQDAYLIYEIPVEGGMSRSLALYKDKQTEKIGTVRSARHDFLDYALEHDAILVHFGWSVYAKGDISNFGINNINGLSDSPFWRENPENLASEHTAYTSLEKCKAFAKKKGYRETTEVKIPLSYKKGDVDLSEFDDVQVANEVHIPYSSSYKVKFIYDQKNSVYKRYVNNKVHIDYFTKEEYTTKNIIVIKLDYTYKADNYYLELDNIGTGTGYYITNGYAKEIIWEKKSRKDQTMYRYKDGTTIDINDGNTYIMIQTNKQILSIN